MTHIHEETLRYIDQTAKINIISNILLKVSSADAQDFPNADVLIASLHGGHTEKNASAAMNIKISDDDKNVDILIEKLQTNTDFHCELKVPLRANLFINAKENVSVENMFSENINIDGEKDIFTKNLRADDIQLKSNCGNIKCNGLLLGRNASISTLSDGNISADKLQGDVLHCITDKGNISTNSCYVESTKIETNDGNLKLKNIHKKAEVIVHNKGNLDMVGFHGNLNLRSNGGTMCINLSELSGINNITADGINDSTINITEMIEKASNIKINADHINLDESLNHLKSCINDDNKVFLYEQEKESADVSALNVLSKNGGIIKLGKANWMDGLGIKLN